MDFATIGLLATIGKTLVDTFKGVRDLLDTKDPRRIADKSPENFDKLKENFIDYQKRLEMLALQLERSETLTRMIPTWFADVNRLPLWKDVTTLQSSELWQVHHDLQELIRQSIHDHFSSTFFRTDFDALSGVDQQMIVFRGQLNQLDNRVRTIQPGNEQVFRGLWSTLALDINNLRDTAITIERMGEDIHGKLIHELRDAAQQKVS
jgi:hypothetical protein